MISSHYDEFMKAVGDIKALLSNTISNESIDIIPLHIWLRFLIAESNPKDKEKNDRLSVSIIGR